MDEADYAGLVVDQELAALLAAHKAQYPAPGASATHCKECGNPIPEGRRINVPGTQYCTEHQAEIEAQGRRLYGIR